MDDRPVGSIAADDKARLILRALAVQNLYVVRGTAEA
jgi:hypothetical protein